MFWVLGFCGSGCVVCGCLRGKTTKGPFEPKKSRERNERERVGGGGCWLVVVSLTQGGPFFEERCHSKDEREKEKERARKRGEREEREGGTVESSKTGERGKNENEN